MIKNLKLLSNQGNAYLFAIAAVLLWSTIPTAFKLGLQFQSNYQLLTGSSIVSMTVLFIIIAVSGKLGKLRFFTARDIAFSMIMGILNPFVYYLVLFKAYTILPAQVAQPLNMIWPIILVLISIPILRQRIHLVNILAMMISFSGVAIISYQGGTAHLNPDNSLGIILALSSSVIWAFYWILNVKDQKDKAVRLFLNFLFATVYLLVGGIIERPFLPVSAEAWCAAVYVGLFEMGITFLLWLKALEYTSSTDRVSNLVYIAPFINLVFVNLILKEEIFYTTVFGIILLISGILLQNLKKGHAKKL